ncbi:MAG: SH3 domain-containing protein [Hyphomicrobiaceae bacterium]|nr:SH3 domain-containing protein [Hyphomicrobiaceae bacterium]
MTPTSYRLFLAVSGFSALAATHARAGQVVPGEEHCVIQVATDDVLHIRAKPNARASIHAKKRHNACGIMVTGTCKRSWCPVEDGHVTGWVNSHFIGMVSPALYCVAGVAPGDSLNLRAYPSARSRVLTRLGRHQCSIAFLPYAVGDWQKIRADGWEGWANRRYLSGQ